MNKVMMKEVIESTILSDLRGSLWAYKGSDGDSELYIMAQVSFDEFCLISLESGNRLFDPSNNFREVTKNATLVVREATIVVEAL